MAWKDVTGRLTDAGGTVLDPARQPRLWAVPERATAFGAVLLTDDEVRADLKSDGTFTVRLQNIPGIRYRLWLDRLKPGWELMEPRNRTREWVPWFEPFHPGDGGNIGDLVPIDYVGAIWVGQTPPPGGPSYPVGTRWLDSNPSSPEFGRIKKWGSSMSWQIEVDVRGPQGPEGQLPADAARRSDPGYPQPDAENIIEVVDARGAMSFVVARGSDGAPTHAAGALIAKTLIELGYTLDGSGGGTATGHAIAPGVLRGDSTMADEPFKAGLETKLGFVFHDAALAGITMWEVAFLAGVLDVAISVTGNTHPGTGSVAVTSITSGTWNAAVGVRRETPVEIAGTRFLLVHPDSSNPGFELKAFETTDPVQIPAGSPVTVLPGAKTGIGWERSAGLLMAGRNVPADFTKFVQATTALLAKTNTRLIMPPWKIAGESPGTTAAAHIDAMVDWERTNAADIFFDLPAWLRKYGLDAASIPATSADDTAIAEGRIPPSLTADGLHLKPAVSAILDEPIAFEVRRKGL